VVTYLLALLVLPIEKPPGFNLRNLLIYFTPGAIVALFIAGPFLGNLGGWMIGFGRLNTNPLWILSGVIYYIGVPVICLAGFGAIYLLIKKERAGLFFGLGAVVPLLAIMAVSTFQYSANRYIFVSLISWTVLASLAAHELLLRQQGETRLLAVAVLALLLCFSLSEDYLYYRYQNGNRENWRAALEFIQARQRESDLVFLSDTDLGNYYLERPTQPMANFNRDMLLENNNRVWFIEDMTTEELFPQRLTWIQENAWPAASFDVTVRGRNFKMRVYLFDPAWENVQHSP
jgi:hypothetical protein